MVADAAEAGMALVAITDHDTMDGVAEAVAHGQTLGVEVWPGIELSTGRGEEVHILGYGLVPTSPGVQAFLASQLESRQARIEAMLARLRQMDMPITAEEATSPRTGFMGRMPLASAMVRRGYVATVQEAFDRYLNASRPAFVPRERVDVTEGIAQLVASGAVPVLAHPGRLKMDEWTLTTLLPSWKEAGLAGMEAYHSSHSLAEARRFDKMARAHGLLITGGSDCHGREGGAAIGAHLLHWRTMQDDVATLRRYIVQGSL